MASKKARGFTSELVPYKAGQPRKVIKLNISTEGERNSPAEVYPSWSLMLKESSCWVPT